MRAPPHHNHASINVHKPHIVAGGPHQLLSIIDGPLSLNQRHDLRLLCRLEGGLAFGQWAVQGFYYRHKKGLLEPRLMAFENLKEAFKRSGPLGLF